MRRVALRGACESMGGKDRNARQQVCNAGRGRRKRECRPWLSVTLQEVGTRARRADSLRRPFMRASDFAHGDVPYRPTLDCPSLALFTLFVRSTLAMIL